MGSIIHHTFHENTHITKHYIMLYENITLIKIYIYIYEPLYNRHIKDFTSEQCLIHIIKGFVENIYIYILPIGTSS